MNAHMGIRELCRQSERSPYVSSPLSPAYLSRLERKTGEIDPEKVGIDTLWALGVSLEVDPLLLFVLSRPQLSSVLLRRDKREALFDVWDVPDGPLGGYLRSRRHHLGLSIAEVSHAATKQHACFGISAGFLSQVETDFRGMSGTVSGEKLWALGVVLRVDPMGLYVLSRHLGSGLILRRHRLFLFRHFSL
jgi:transcriptional regulator with XRE-family HTH domain